MKAVIKNISIFNDIGNIRTVDFNRGINIITGNSKTGKSAILEIVDYCLFSSISSIPEGIISDFSHLFCVIYELDNKYIIIGRHAKKTGKSSKSYIKIETDDTFLTNFSFSYFENIIPINLKDAQARFEQFIGLSVTDMSSSSYTKKEGKASIRSASSLLFQHQNLVANKHALFHRFENSEKKDKTIKELPIFLNWVDGNYYSYLRELELLEKDVKIEERIKIRAQKTRIDKEKTINNILFSYFSYINYQYDNSIPLLKLANNLPLVPEISYSSDKTWEIFNNLDQEISNNRRNLSEIEKKIALLENSGNQAFSYIRNLNNIQATLNINPIKSKDIHCPLCESHLKTMQDKISIITDSRHELVEKIKKIGLYSEDSSEQLSLLNTERNKIKKEIRISRAKQKEIEQKQKDIKNKVKFRDSAMEMRGKTIAQLEEFFNRDNIIKNNDNLQDTIKRISFLKDKIKSYGLDIKYRNANDFMSKNMTSICNDLDFEDELKPVTLHFKLETFEFFIMSNNKKVYLYEMGSGANWLACHLSLFISLLHLNCKEKKSSLPSILFLDQPSQVYFPSGDIKEDDKDLKQVANIFDVINTELNNIHKETNELAQIIILEHADNLSLKNNVDFNSLVTERWTEKTNKKLI